VPNIVLTVDFNLKNLTSKEYDLLISKRFFLNQVIFTKFSKKFENIRAFTNIGFLSGLHCLAQHDCPHHNSILHSSISQREGKTGPVG
jgi:hypothetical protein